MVRGALLLAVTAWSPAAQQPPAWEFEVASVKASPVDGRGYTAGDRGGPESDTPRRWSCEYCSLRDLLGRAFGIGEYQIAGPAWMADARFHIETRLPAKTTRAQFREMLRNLLIARFTLASHFEQRPMAQAELRVARDGPRLPRTAGPAAGDPEVRTVRGHFRLRFPNAGIQDLAEELSIKLSQPVSDRTGLPGNFDIVLDWAEDDSGPGLKQALRDQLGLELVEKKGPVDVLVVEHIDKAPKEN